MLCVDHIALRQGRHFDVDDVGVLQLPNKIRTSWDAQDMSKYYEHTSNYIIGFLKHQMVQHLLGNFGGS